MTDDNRGPCPICDRLVCARSGLVDAYMAKMDRWREGTSDHPTVGEGNAIQEAILECDRHRVDWRTRCLKAETTLDEIERLRGQLPDGMKHCTIVFRECSRGHGWLTATNWVQHSCPTCERDALRSLLTDAYHAMRPMSGTWTQAAVAHKVAERIRAAVDVGE